MDLMPVELRYDREKEVLCVAVKGPLTPEEFEGALKDIIRSDQFPPDIRSLWDMREADLKDIDRGIEERLINIRKEYPERGSARVAVVVVNDRDFGMSRMYQSLSEDLSRPMQVFRSYTEAEDWLLRP